jgi:hypothetical protein
MKTKGQFVVFTLEEFAHWLENTQFERRVVRIQNHHTLSPSYSDFDGANHFALLEGMKRYHVEHNGWADIGQQLTTFPDGTVALCRPFERVPACIFGANAGAVCIENLGDFDVGRDSMTDAQARCIVQVNALLCREFSLPVNSNAIVYHHWYDLGTGERNDGTHNNKSCPGTAFFGGNSVAACEAGFLPRVAAALAALGAPGQPGEPSTSMIVKVLAPDGALAIRSAPRQASTRLGALPNGTVVRLYESHGIWRRIDPSHSRWVSSRFLVPA